MPLRRRRGESPQRPEPSVKLSGGWYKLVLLGFFVASFWFFAFVMPSWTNQFLDGLAKWQLQRGISHTDSNLDKVTTATFNINEQYGEAGYIFIPCTNSGDPSPSESNPVSCHLSGQISKLRTADLVAANKDPGSVNPSLTVMKAEHALVNKQFAAIRASKGKLSVQQLNALGYASIASSTTPVSASQRDNLAVDKTSQVTPCIIQNPDADLKETANCVDKWYRIGHGYEQPSILHLSYLSNNQYRLLFGLVCAIFFTVLFHAGRMRSTLGGLFRAFTPPAFRTAPWTTVNDIIRDDRKPLVLPAPHDRRDG